MTPVTSDRHPLNNADARGLVIGSTYVRSGALAASTSLDALWRF